MTGTAAEIRVTRSIARVPRCKARERASGVRGRADADVPGDAVPPLRGRRAGFGDDVAPPGSVVRGDVVGAATPRPYRLPLLRGLAPRWLAIAAVACLLCRQMTNETHEGGMADENISVPVYRTPTQSGLPVVLLCRAAADEASPSCRNALLAPGMTIHSVHGRP